MNESRLRITKYICLIFLGGHLFITHARLIFSITPEKKDIPFSFTSISDESVLISVLASIAYSIITVLILTLYSPKENKYRIPAVLTFGILDAIVVMIYYNTGIERLFIMFSSTYYSVYTFCIIIFLGLHKFSSKRKYVKRDETPEGALNGHETRDNKIFSLFLQGKTGVEIAKQMDISSATVSRAVKKLQKQDQN